MEELSEKGSRVGAVQPKGKRGHPGRGKGSGKGREARRVEEDAILEKTHAGLPSFSRPTSQPSDTSTARGSVALAWPAPPVPLGPASTLTLAY